MSWFGNDMMALACIFGSATVSGAATVAFMSSQEHAGHHCRVEMPALSHSVVVTGVAPSINLTTGVTPSARIVTGVRGPAVVVTKPTVVPGGQECVRVTSVKLEEAEASLQELDLRLQELDLQLEGLDVHLDGVGEALGEGFQEKLEARIRAELERAGTTLEGKGSF